MKDLAKFGTAAFQLHPSGLRSLTICPWRTVMKYLEAPEEEHGPAGDTGSAVHAAIAHVHRGGDAAAGLAEMQRRRERYPLADLQTAAAMFLAYAQDPRNRDADIALTEHPFRFDIAPAKEDPTQEPIQIAGTLDQVRREAGILRLWDVKSSNKDPLDLLWQHTMQAAAYCIGGSVALGEPVHPGGLILTRMYAKGKNPFWPFTWTFTDIETILEPVRHVVASIRRGNVYHMPNDNCAWCEMRGQDYCLPKLQELKLKLRDI